LVRRTSQQAARALASLVLVLALALPVARVHAEPPLTRLTLAEAVAAALASNPTLRAKTLEVSSVRANEITAGLIPNPQASYTATQLGSRNQDQQHTLTVGQTIETGGKRRRRVESARAATAVTTQELFDVRRQVILQVKKAFTDGLVARATLALAEDNLKSLDEVERIQRFRAERGDISELELTRLQVQRFAFERDAADARLAGEAARIALRAAIGPAAVDERVDILGELDFRDVPADLEALRQRALEARPDLKAAAAAYAKAQADVNLARANAWWDVTPQALYERIGPDNTFGFGVSIPLRIFDRNQGEIARTLTEVDRTASLRQAVATQVLADVDTAYAGLVSQRERVVRLRDVYLPKALQVRRTVEFAYRRGGVSLLDFLDAQRTYRETAGEHIRALGNFWAAVYQLEAAAGGSLEQ
jgi:cobalt-zinc-cadmium efflux system outer membrane protein